MKSNVSDSLKVMLYILEDAYIKCSADVSELKRDYQTISRRVEDEGLSFLTISLPMFAKAFERSLARGSIDSTAFLGFRIEKAGRIPAFMRGIVSLIFDRETGELFYDLQSPLEREVATAVESVRQVCRAFSKVEIECTTKRVHSAISAYIEIEHAFSAFNPDEDETRDFREVSDLLWGNAFSDFNSADIAPRHGPGATADKRHGNMKYIWSRWHLRLEPYFPWVGTAYPLGVGCDENSEEFSDWPSKAGRNSKEFRSLIEVPMEQEQPVKVITVPKTLKAPRIIAVEPCCMQYAQQGIRRYLYRAISSYTLTKGHVNFTDQTVNQAMALDSSASGQYATIDLSEASDRVPRSLALDMFRNTPDLQGAIDACRSYSARLPNGDILPLAKFASMGSALCFPVEAMYFFTLCVKALLDFEKLSYIWLNVKHVAEQVYVYGDDILVPSAKAEVVLQCLQKYNLKVNAAKSFWTGKFRESCGVDAYAGAEVTPTYLRKLLPENKRDSASIVATVASANQFYLKGYWRTAQYLYDFVEKIVGDLPYVSANCEGLGRVSLMGWRSRQRWNSDLQRFEIKALVPKVPHRTDEVSGYAALTKSLLMLENPKNLDDLVSDELHLKRSVLRGEATLRRRWVLP